MHSNCQITYGKPSHSGYSIQNELTDLVQKDRDNENFA